MGSSFLKGEAMGEGEEQFEELVTLVHCGARATWSDWMVLLASICEASSLRHALQQPL